MIKKSTTFVKIIVSILCLISYTQTTCSNKENKLVECVKKYKKEIAIGSGVTVSAALLATLCYWHRTAILKSSWDGIEGFIIGFMSWPGGVFELVVDHKIDFKGSHIEGAGKPAYVLGGLINAILLGTGSYTLVRKAKELKERDDKQSSFKKQMSKLKALCTLLS